MSNNRKPIERVAAALAIRAATLDQATPLRGAALASLRRRAVRGELALPEDPAAASAHRQLLGLRPDNMPPDPQDFGLLVEIACLRLGGVSRADLWRSLNVPVDTGNAYLGRNAGSVSWFIWHTLRTIALGAQAQAQEAAPGYSIDA